MLHGDCFFDNDSIGAQEVVNEVEAVEDEAVAGEEEKMSNESSGEDDDIASVLNIFEILQNSKFVESDEKVIN